MSSAAILAFERGPRAAVPLVQVLTESGSGRTSRCSICNLRQVCLPCDLMHEGKGQASEVFMTDRRVKQGEALFRTGADLKYLYTVRTGFFKTVQGLGDGREQITGFHMAGDLLGADALGARVHCCDAVALEDSHVCAVLYSRIEDLLRTMPQIQHQLRKALSAEIVREQGVMLLLGTMTAEERVVVFLLGLSRRLMARGYSPTEFILRMTRGEIGSYLGLKLETVSRMFSKLRIDGLIGVNQRSILLRDLAGLQRVARRDGHAAPAVPFS